MGAFHSEGERRWVYFAKRDGLVKIGYSANPTRRAKQLRAELLAVMPGGYRLEGFMHRQFAEYRKYGEWFHPGLGLIDFIEALHGDDPYRKVDLPGEYARAELDRLVLEDRAEEARAELVRKARELTIGDEHPGAGVWPRPIPGDKFAADVIGALLSPVLPCLIGSEQVPA